MMIVIRRSVPPLCLIAALIYPSISLAKLDPPVANETAQAIKWSLHGQPLGNVLTTLQQKTGIHFQLAPGLENHPVTGEVRAPHWEQAIQQILEHYNRVGFINAEGKLDRVLITGLHGDGSNPPAPLLDYPANRLDASRSRPRPQIPPHLQALPKGSAVPVRLNRSRLFQLNPGSTISFTLPSGQTDVVFDHSVQHANGDQSWIGHIGDHGREYRVILTFGANGNYGRILTPERIYRIEPGPDSDWLIDIVASGLQPGDLSNDSVKHKDSSFRHQDFGLNGMSGFESHAPRRFHAASPIPVETVSAAEADTGDPESVTTSGSDPVGDITLVDVIALYTPGMQALDGDLMTRFNHLFMVANQAFKDSEIKIQLRLVHTALINYSDSTANRIALADISDGAGDLAGIKPLRDQHGADLVTLIRPFNLNGHRSCGTAWVIGAQGRPFNPESAYSVVSDGSDGGFYCTEYTLAHELAHNMGSVHDRGHSTFEGHFPYSFGHGEEGKFGTVMSYLNPGLGLFSNPAKDCNGYLCGIDENELGAANNTLSLNNVRTQVAAFRATVHPVPAPPENDAATVSEPETVPQAMRQELAAGFDFNRDGQADMLWQDASNASIWLMDGTSRSTEIPLPPLPTGFSLIAAADFNGDGNPDLLSRNRYTGAVEITFMDGPTPGAPRQAPDASSEWRMIHTADFDGDRRTDILWQNQNSLYIVLWLMDGEKILESRRIFPRNPDWQILRCADFDQDGMIDLLWRHRETGASYIGLMNGFNQRQAVALPTLSLAWTPLAAADFDHDGFPDLIWHHRFSGELMLWQMAGGNLIEATPIATVSDRNWHMAGVADYNSDGKADLFWRHIWGRNRIMLMDGSNEPTQQYSDWQHPRWLPIFD